MADVWPFRPVRNSTESLSWSTNVMRAGTAERRVSLRSARQKLIYSYSTRSRMFNRMLDTIRENLIEDWDVPVWHELTKATGIVTGQTVIAVNPAEWIAGRKVLIWAGVDSWTLRTILSYDGTNITLTTTVGSNYPTALVMPVRTCYVEGGFSFSINSSAKRSGINWGGFYTSQIQFTSRDEAPAGIEPEYSFGDVGIIRNCGVPAPLDGSINGDVAFIDNDFGVVTPILVRELLQPRFSTLKRARTPADIVSLKAMLHWMRGKDQSFWFVGWGHDLSLVTQIDPGDVSIVVRPLFPSLADYIGKYICIDDGEPTIRLITNASLTGLNHRLSLSSIGRTVVSAKISFAKLCRLDVDDVDLFHVQGFYAETDLTLIEVPE